MVDINQRSNPKESLSDKLAIVLSIVSSPQKIDIFFIAFSLLIGYSYFSYISTLNVPVWDGAVYLLNAKDWIGNTNLLQPYRPPLLSWIIDGIWVFTGEDWKSVKYIQAIFTISANVLLYLVLRKKKSPLFALGVCALTFSNSQLFFYTSQILSEGISLFFLILTLYFMEGRKKVHYMLSGISIGLTFGARYPILLQSLLVYIISSIFKKDHKSMTKGIILATCIIILIVALVYLKTGVFEMALAKDSKFGSLFSSYYLINALSIWGPTIILLPIAFLFRSTFSNKFNYIFIIWFVISFVAWSSNPSHDQYRFMIQFMPATYFLVMLALENLINFNRSNLIFTRLSTK